MKRANFALLLFILLALTSCHDDPVAPRPPQPTIAEQIAAWNPRIIVEEPLGWDYSLEIYTITLGDTICLGAASFRIDSANNPDSVKWALGAGEYTTKRFAVTDIPVGLHTVQALVRKRFSSASEKKDTVVERFLERSFVSLDESHSLAIGEWVPVNPNDDRIDTLRVIYKGIIPGIPDSLLRNFVLGATRGCDTARWNTRSMPLALRRYAINFERRPSGGVCSQVFGELVLSSPSQGLYRYRTQSPTRIDSVPVRRIQ